MRLACYAIAAGLLSFALGGYRATSPSLRSRLAGAFRRRRPCSACRRADGTVRRQPSGKPRPPGPWPCRPDHIPVAELRHAAERPMAAGSTAELRQHAGLVARLASHGRAVAAGVSAVVTAWVDAEVEDGGNFGVAWMDGGADAARGGRGSRVGLGARGVEVLPGGAGGSPASRPCRLRDGSSRDYRGAGACFFGERNPRP